MTPSSSLRIATIKVVFIIRHHCYPEWHTARPPARRLRELRSPAFFRIASEIFESSDIKLLDFFCLMVYLCINNVET